MVLTAKHEGGDNMMKGCFFTAGVGHLHVISGNVNADYCEKIIKHCVQPYCTPLLGYQQCIYQQYSAPTHCWVC